MMADIEKLFHQIMVQEKDRESLRFIWRSIKSSMTCARKSTYSVRFTHHVVVFCH